MIALNRNVVVIAAGCAQPRVAATRWQGEDSRPRNEGIEAVVSPRLVARNRASVREDVPQLLFRAGGSFKWPIQNIP